jgi:hypothetical protein
MEGRMARIVGAAPEPVTLPRPLALSAALSGAVIDNQLQLG